MRNLEFIEQNNIIIVALAVIASQLPGTPYKASASPPTVIKAPARGPLVIIAAASALLVELPERLVAAA